MPEIAAEDASRPSPAEKFYFYGRTSVASVTTSHQDSAQKQVLVAAGVVPGLLQFATADLPAGVQIEAHAHASMTEVFHALAGRVLARVDDRQFEFAIGDTLVIPAGTVHSFEALTDVSLIYFSLESSPALASLGDQAPLMVEGFRL